MPTPTSTVTTASGWADGVDERRRGRSGDRRHGADRQVDAAGRDDERHPQGDEQGRRGAAQDRDQAAVQVAVDDTLMSKKIGDFRRVATSRATRMTTRPEQPVSDDRLHGAASAAATVSAPSAMIRIRSLSVVPAVVELGDLVQFAHHDDAVGQPQHLVELGGDEQHRDAVVGEGGDEALDLRLGADVDAAGGLVEEQQLGRRQQPAGEQHLLLVAAGEVGDDRLRVGRADVEGLDVLVGELGLLAAGDRPRPAAWPTASPGRCWRAR